MKFNKDQSYDYDATAKAICEAVIKSTNPELSLKISRLNTMQIQQVF